MGPKKGSTWEPPWREARGCLPDAHGRRATCEATLSVDVRQWHRKGCLRAGLRFACSWTRGGEPTGSIDVRTETDAVVLMLKARGSASSERKSVEQRVPLMWTRCHLGGARSWFRCSASVGGRPCGRRVAKLYLRGHSSRAASAVD
jgi:hypothetical protein